MQNVYDVWIKTRRGKIIISVGSEQFLLGKEQISNINWPKPIVHNSVGPSFILLLIKYKCGHIDNSFLIHFFLVFSIMIDLILEKQCFTFISMSSLFSIFLLDFSYNFFLLSSLLWYSLFINHFSRSRRLFKSTID